LHLIDAYPDKKLKIYLVQANHQISLRSITQTDVKVSLSYEFSKTEFTIDAKDTYSIQD